MTIFVGGVHAVGKTYVLKPVCESLGIRHATASQLTKEQRGLSNWTASRQVGDIEENQRALIAAVTRLEQDEEALVLDGHFVLRRSPGVHEEIGVDTFDQLMIRGVILLETPSAIVAERLLQRGDTTWQEAEITHFAERESEHATTVCQQLSVPLIKLSSFSMADVQRAISNCLSKG
jgi:adenylate kinase